MRSIVQCVQSYDGRIPRHSSEAPSFLPGIDIEPGKRGKDGEPRSVSICANRRAEELAEPDPMSADSAAWVISDYPMLFTLLCDAVSGQRRCERLLNCSFQIRHAEGLLNEDRLRTQWPASHRIASDEHMRDEFDFGRSL